MPADEVAHGTDVDGSRARIGPRHAAPKRPLFTRFHMPGGKAIASVAMPTAVIVGMGFTSTLALADNGSTPSTSNSQKAADYKDCVAALDGSKDASASPSPSASESTATPTPTPTASTQTQDSKTTGTTSSSDSGSGGQATPTPTATSGSGSDSGSSGSGGGSTATPTPSASQSSGGTILDTIGDTIGDIGNVLTGGTKDSGTSASPTPSASESSSPAASPSSGSSDTGSAADTVKDTATKAATTVTDTVKNTTDTVSKTADSTTQAVTDAAASATPSPSASSSTSAADCPAATDDVSGVDNKVPVADDPWYLNASSLLLKGADYQGIVEVKTAGGTTKKVLKYVISGGTDIGDLHQTVNDKQSGKVYHVQAEKGSTSTIRNGDTVMYTQSISGNLFGLIPVTFSPDSPPPLNIPLIYFTNVKVTQAAQFGGDLHVPGMHVYTTD